MAFVKSLIYTVLVRNVFIKQRMNNGITKYDDKEIYRREGRRRQRRPRAQMQSKQCNSKSMHDE